MDRRQVLAGMAAMGVVGSVNPSVLLRAQSSEPQSSTTSKEKYEDRKLPMMPIRDLVIFPFMMTPFVVGRESSVRALEEALAADKKIFLATQHDASIDEPKANEIYQVGTIVNIVQSLKLPDGNIKVLVEGIERGKILEVTDIEGFMRATVRVAHFPNETNQAIEASMQRVTLLFEQYVKLCPALNYETMISARQGRYSRDSLIEKNLGQAVVNVDRSLPSLGNDNFGRAAESVQKRDFVSQKAFHRMISIERRRTERSGKPFLLMLLDMGDHLPTHTTEKDFGWLLEALSVSTRETHVVGWYESGRVAGVMFTEIRLQDHKTIVGTMISRLSEILRNHLTLEQFNRVSVSFHVFPVNWDTESCKPSNSVFYPVWTKDAAKLTDLISANLQLSIEEKQELLEIFDPAERLTRIADVLDIEIGKLKSGA